MENWKRKQDCSVTVKARPTRVGVSYIRCGFVSRTDEGFSTSTHQSTVPFAFSVVRYYGTNERFHGEPPPYAVQPVGLLSSDVALSYVLRCLFLLSKPFPQATLFSETITFDNLTKPFSSVPRLPIGFIQQNPNIHPFYPP